MYRDRRPCFALLATLLLVGCGSEAGNVAEGAGAAPAAEPDYRIELDLDPEARRMAVEVQMDVQVEAEGEPLRFLLHSDLSLDGVQGPGVADTETTPGFDPFGLPESHITLVEVHPDEGLGAGDPLEIHWRYSGWIESDRVQLGADAFHPDWVELDVGSLWLPTRPELTERFVYEARVRVPEGFEVVGAGEVRREGRVRTFVTELPHLTGTFAVAPTMRSTLIEGPVDLMIHNPGEWEGEELLAAQASEALEHFVEWFGPLPEVSQLQIVLPPDRRSRMEGYQRDRYIMLTSELPPGETRLHLVAHEAAHLWWNRAPPQGPANFLNESFAEYGSWLVLEAEYGDAAFERRLEAAREAAAEVGSIRDWTPQTGGPLVYARGPLLLHELRERMRDQAFFELLHALHGRRVTELEAFFEAVAEHGGEATAHWLEQEF